MNFPSMTYFEYRKNELCVEGISLATLALKYKTPLYVYSYNQLHDNFLSFKKAFEKVDHLICYSMKANSNRSILKTFINEGGGVDVVTGGELKRALDAGCPANRIVFAGVGKSEEEIASALKAGILQFNVESVEELDTINRVAKRLNKKAPVAIRVNPHVDPKTHPYISTGLKKSKFGISHTQVLGVYKYAKSLSHLEITGIDCHFGSQLTKVSPFIEAAKRVKDLILKLEKEGIVLQNIDIGGGLGVTYKDEVPPKPDDYAKAILSVFQDLTLSLCPSPLKGEGKERREGERRSRKLIFEPGRFLVAQSGVLLTKVLYNKERDTKHFVIVDAASNDLMRPALYDAYHTILPLQKDPKIKQIKVDVVGPICETGDFLAHDRPLQKVSHGDYLAVMTAGAYGFSMSSNYNSRPRVPEILVDGKKDFVIREREKLEDLTKYEKVPGFLK